MESAMTFRTDWQLVFAYWWTMLFLSFADYVYIVAGVGPAEFWTWF